MKYRKKPVVIDAIQYTDVLSVRRIMHAFGSQGFNNSPEGLFITTLEGTMRADKNDWIIKGVKGEVYPCKPDVFEATYDRVEGMK